MSKRSVLEMTHDELVEAINKAEAKNSIDGKVGYDLYIVHVESLMENLGITQWKACCRIADVEGWEEKQRYALNAAVNRKKKRMSKAKQA